MELHTSSAVGFKKFILLSIFFLNTIAIAQATLVLPVERTTEPGCIPEGRTISYECTVDDNDGSRSTVWQGNAFKCGSQSRINLLHSLYEPDGESGTCGDLSAMSVRTIPNVSYTSNLTLTATAGLNGLTIECTRSGSLLVGSDSLKIGAPPPPPQNATVDVTSASSLTVSWTPPSNTSNVRGYMFTVTGDCGNCEDTTVSDDVTSVSCSGWLVNNQTCFFEVRTVSQNCGFSSASPATTNVTLAVPTSPSVLNVSPVYRLDGSIQYIEVAFMGVDRIEIGIPSTISYTVRIGSQSFTEVQCNISNHCTLTVSGSQLTEDRLLIGSVVASNAVGSGVPHTFPMPVPTNLDGQDIVNVRINVANRVVSCQLLGSFPETAPFVCLIVYGFSPNCDTYTNSSMLETGRPGNTVTISLVENLVPEILYCYTVSVSYGSETLMVDGTFRTICSAGELGSNPSSTTSEGTVNVLNGMVMYNGLTPPDSMAMLICDSGYEPVAGSSVRTCMPNGIWSGSLQSCMAVPFPLWIIAIIVIVLAICGGICVGYVCGVCCQLLYEKIRQRKCATILLVFLLFIALGFGIGLLLSYCCCGREKKSKEDKRRLGKEESQDSRKSPPPPDSLYADPKSIEHEAAPGTEDQYAMVDKKVKKNTKPKPTPPEALYQDPNTIEHKTAASGDTYAVVDKPKRSSKKKGGPDVVPPASEGLTYADIDLSSKRPKPGSGRQAPQQPGEYPKEHPVEYSSVDHGNTSQL